MSVPVYSTPEATARLDDLVSRILARDQALRDGAAAYLRNGIDLIEAKRTLEHGSFETWCAERLSYSKSTAERMMRAAEMFGAMLEAESVTLTDLPSKSLAYALSAPSCPAAIREAYVPRIIAREPHVSAEVQGALAEHRKCENRAKARAKLSPEARAKREKADQAQAKRAERMRARDEANEVRQNAAQAAALALLLARLGDALPRFLELHEASGFSGVLSRTAHQRLAAMGGSETEAPSEVSREPVETQDADQAPDAAPEPPQALTGPLEAQVRPREHRTGHAAQHSTHGPQPQGKVRFKYR